MFSAQRDLQGPDETFAAILKGRFNPDHAFVFERTMKRQTRELLNLPPKFRGHKAIFMMETKAWACR